MHAVAAACEVRGHVVITGLHNKTSYTFTVTAVNGAGASPPSVGSDPVVPVEGGRKHDSAPEGIPRADVPAPPASTTRPPPPPDMG